MESSVGSIRHDRSDSSQPQSTFDKQGSFFVNEPVGSATISPAGRDVALASRLGLHIIDLDNPYAPPRHLPHRTSWEVADVQWSPFASRDSWIASTSNQNALIWNVAAPAAQAVEHVLQAHTRALTDINFSAHEPDILATCSVDSFVHVWDLRAPARPATSFADWYAGATQVKWNRQNSHILASSHDQKFHIWDTRKDSHPLQTIDAHGTKIYGIDWNRVEATHLLTCSLDRTIKLWDYAAAPQDRLIRVINTPYPVWRARHTPFGHGVLVMPQRGNNELHLYDKRLEPGQAIDAPAEPVHSFEGHTDQVKEFLWRVRHGEDDGRDNRTFQLVSWGADKHLRLHPMDEDVLDRIGYHQGQELHSRQRFSRKGAVNRSYHDPENLRHAQPLPSPNIDHDQRRSSAISQAINSGTTRTTGNLSLASIRAHRGLEYGVRIRSGERKQANPISWMKGVKISAKEDTSSPRDSTSMLTTSQIVPWDVPESLGDEIAIAGDRYKKVTFEEVNVAARTVTLSLNGPWGAERATVHLRLTIVFPRAYPDNDAPQISVEKTSSVSEETFKTMIMELKMLTDEYASENLGSLEAIMRYLLGDQDLEQSRSWLRRMHNVIHDDLDHAGTAESSDDEEDGLLGNLANIKIRDLESGTGDLMNLTRLNNANVPLPKQCAALFSPCGKLVCFFPTKKTSIFDDVASILGSQRTKDEQMFEGFGNLQHALRKQDNGFTANEGEDDSPTSEYSYSSSSNSSATSDDAENDMMPFSNFLLLGGMINKKPARSMDRSLDRSQNLSLLSVNKADSKKLDMHISIHHSYDDKYPRRALAEGYIMLGKAEEVCSHNAAIARTYGFEHYGDVWDFARLILCDEVPLDINQKLRKDEDFLVIARRSIVHIKRKDSGMDFGFDWPAAVREPKLKARVKWGRHPLGNDYLVQAMFNHFETAGDIQMLAMLSCVFCEPAAPAHAPSAMSIVDSFERSGVCQLPGFTLEYWPFSKVPKSFIQNAPKRSKLKVSFSRTPSKTSARSLPEVFGSSASDDGILTIDAPPGRTYKAQVLIAAPAENEEVIKEAIKEATTASPKPKARPLKLTRENSNTSSKGRSFGTSPENVLRRSSSIMGNAMSKVAQLISGSPPLLRKEATADFSTSAPSASIPIPSAMKTKAKSGANSVRFSSPRSNLQQSQSTHAGADDDNDTEPDEEQQTGKKTRIKLKNQNKFDDEACYGAPLIQPNHYGKHNLWRDEYATHLDAWDLRHQYHELLSFNHLTLRYTSLDPQDPLNPPTQPSFRLADRSHQGLQSSIFCTHCGRHVETTTISPNAAWMDLCPGCARPVARMSCTICAESITSAFKHCTNCGHASHAECFEEWLDDDSFFPWTRTCEACACRCREFVTVGRRYLVATEDPVESESPSRPSTAILDEEKQGSREGEKTRRGSTATATMKRGIFGGGVWQ